MDDQIRQSLGDDFTPFSPIANLDSISYIFLSIRLYPKPSCLSFGINVFDLKMFITY